MRTFDKEKRVYEVIVKKLSGSVILVNELSEIEAKAEVSKEKSVFGQEIIVKEQFSNEIIVETLVIKVFIRDILRIIELFK
jgi:hypothetical protein